MSPIDVKKLITGFLVLAIFASSGVLIFSSSKTTISSSDTGYPEEELSPEDAILSQSALADPSADNPFLASDDFTLNYEPGTYLELENDPSSGTLTEIVLRNMARKFISSNPSAVKDIQEGKTPSLSELADLDKLLEESLPSIKLEGFPTEISSDGLYIIENPTADDNSQYINGILGAISKIVSKPTNLVSLGNTETEPLERDLRRYRETREELQIISVPKPLLKLHKSILLLLGNQEKIAETIISYAEDPLRALILIEGQTNILARDYLAFDAQLNAIQFVEQTSLLKEGLQNALAITLGVKKAEAYGISGTAILQSTITSAIQAIIPQLITYLTTNRVQASLDALAAKIAIQTSIAYSVPVYSAKDTLQAKAQTKATVDTAGATKDQFWQGLSKKIVEIIKNAFVHAIINEIIRWVNGGGKPQYVTNWKSFLKKSFNQAAGLALSQTLPQLCQPFQQIVQLSTVEPPNAPPYAPVKCTLNQVVGNFKAYSKNIKTGGWLAWQTAAQPHNNIFGVTPWTKSIVSGIGSENREASEEDAQAGNGFLSQKKCQSGGTPNQTTGLCPNGEQPQLLTTPGAIVANITQDSIGNSLDHIVNAEDWQALIKALVDGSINKLMKKGVDGLTSY